METDTIAAIATGLSNAGISIVRVSGKDAVEIVDRIFRSKKEGFYLRDAKTHTMHYGVIVGGEQKSAVGKKGITENIGTENMKAENTKIKQKGNILDEVLVSIMRAPNSYTRENVVEINCHGGIVVTRKILEAVIGAGARLAEPGEFTTRAFFNGRIDLSQAEAVMDIIQAKNEIALKNSVRQLRGNMHIQIATLREQILLDVAFIEAALDDPEHISLDGFPEKLEKNVSQYLGKIGKMLKTAENGRMIKEGVKTVILGKPNAGKSSLLNLLLGENRAIVTDVAGTTRDTLEENMMLNGISLNIVDTAGIRWTEDLVEQIGVDKAKKEAGDADLILFVVDSSTPLDENDREILKSVGGKKMLVLLNKTDLEAVVSEEDIVRLVNGEEESAIKNEIGTETGNTKENGIGTEAGNTRENGIGIEAENTIENGFVVETGNVKENGIAVRTENTMENWIGTETKNLIRKETSTEKRKFTEREIIRTSAKEQIGLEALEEKITELFFAGEVSYDDEIYITNARHKAALEEAERSLQQVMESIRMNMPEDFYSIDLMNAYKELGGIIGEEVDEDLVNTIFKEFCMGK